MSVQQVVSKVLANQVLTPEDVAHLNRLLRDPDFGEGDQATFDRLLKHLLSGQVQSQVSEAKE